MERTFEEAWELVQEGARADMRAGKTLETPVTGNINTIEAVEDSAIVLHSEGRPKPRKVYKRMVEKAWDILTTNRRVRQSDVEGPWRVHLLCLYVPEVRCVVEGRQHSAVIE